MATIYNTNSNTLLSGTSKADYIENDCGKYVTIRAGSGNDTLFSDSSNGHVTFSGGAGNDSIISHGYYSGMDDVVILAGGGRDTIQSYCSKTTITGGKGNDFINLNPNNNTEYYTGNNVIKYAKGDGNDLIYNWSSTDTLKITGGSYKKSTVGNNVLVTVGSGVITLSGAKGKTIHIKGTPSVAGGKNISNSNYSTLITGTAYADSIKNYGNRVTINTGAGNDTIYNDGDYVSINAGAGNDSVYCYDDFITLRTGVGDDTVSGASYQSVIDVGSGNDKVNFTSAGYSDYTTIIGGAGNDYITLYSAAYSNVIKYANGDGNDLIYNWSSTDTLKITGGSYAKSTVGSNVLVTVGSGVITLSGAKGKTIHIKGTPSVAGGKNISNSKNSTLITGTAYADSIYNEGWYVTINAGSGNDTLNNNYVNDVSISGGDGNDYISNYSAWYSTVKAGNGDDTIVVPYRAWQDIIDGGAGNDKISLSSSSNEYNGKNTVIGGTGNDTIYGSTGAPYGSVYKYALGDGNDVIYGFKSKDTLHITSGTYSKSTVGNNVLVTVGSGVITLSGAKGKTIHIKGTPIETNKWTVSGTTAKYGTSSKTLITVTGVKSNTSTSNISLSGKTVTLTAAALSTNKVTISDGYKLALASDVKKSKTTSKKWSVSGTTATYKSGRTTAGYKLASNAKSISYTSGSGGSTLATITGLKSGTAASNISTSGNTVTLKAAALNKSKVTITGNYKLALASDVKKSKTTNKKWNLSGTTATYKSGRTTEGYKLASDSKSISYTSGSGGSTLAKITGIKSTSGISESNGVITVKASSIANGKTVSVTGSDYKFKLNGTSGKNTLQGGAGNDTLTGGGGADTFIYTGGNDIITDYTAQDEIKISANYTSKISGDDIILTTNKGTLTIKNSADKSITINGEIKNFSDSLPTGLSYSDDGFTLIVGNNFTVGKIDLSKYATVLDVDASSYRSMNLKITGNVLNNSLIGGSGSDTINGGAGDDILTGGGGMDTFIYDGGNDHITDYAAGEDTIRLKNTTFKNVEADRNDIVIETSTGFLTLKGASGKEITLFDSSGKDISSRYSPNIAEIIADNSIGEFENYNEKPAQENLITFAE